MSPAAQRWFCLAGMLAVIAFGGANGKVPAEHADAIARVATMGVLCGWSLATLQIKEGK